MSDRQVTAMTRPDAPVEAASGRQDAPPGGLSIVQAAAHLGVTPEALRLRLHRGTLAGAKTDEGEWRVWLPDGEAGTPPGPLPGPQPGERQATGRIPPVPHETTPHPAVEALLENPQSEIVYLREQLAQRSRELAAERERFDLLHREAFARIPALGVNPDAPQTSPPMHHATEATEAAAASVPWWRFWERWR